MVDMALEEVIEEMRVADQSKRGGEDLLQVPSWEPS
jgi:hypothetical protein